MYKRGMSSDPVKQERIDQVLKSVPGGKKKWVRYDEGAVLYTKPQIENVIFSLLEHWKKENEKENT